MTDHASTFPPDNQPISQNPGTQTPKTATEESLPTCFPLRSDLVVHQQAGTSRRILEDCKNNKFFRLGNLEAAFVERLLQCGSAEQAWQVSCEAVGHDQAKCLTQQGALTLCKWLLANGLVDLQGSGPSTPMPNAGQPQGVLALLGNCFFWRRSLLNPDASLAWLVSRIGWLFAWQTMAAGQLVLVFALLSMVGNWDKFLASYENLFSPWRGAWLAVAWFVLKLIHELAHGCTCRRYGGEVREAGIAMILLMPLAYVDVTSSWRFPSRWRRLHVTLAGVGAELIVAGLALFAWGCFDSLTIKQAAADLVLLASISSLLFNLNPLLKFDGYFALADSTGVDNLYGYGQSYARYWGARYVCGLHAKVPDLPAGHAWIKPYGLAAAVYRALTISGLIIAAAALFHGAGIVIAIAGFASFMLIPLIKLTSYLTQLYRCGELIVSRLAIRLGGFAVTILLLLLVAPADIQMTTPAIVQYDPPSVVRSPVDGFIETVHVDDGQLLTVGQPIVTIRNDELQLSVAKLRKDLMSVEQEMRSARWQGDSSTLADAAARQQGLREQLNEKQIQLESLVVRAPSAGRMVARQLKTLLGRYVHQGDEMGVVGFEQRKRLKISLDQREASGVRDWSRSPVTVVVPGHRSWKTQISHVESRASDAIPDDSLIAINGGRLPVVQVSSSETTLCEPRITAYVKLTEATSRQLHCGRRAFVHLNRSRDSLADVIWGYVARAF